jgi:hypothetical protein
MEYIEGLPSFNITCRRRIKHNQDLLSGYADSDWGNNSSRRSTSGNLMLYNQAPTMWRTKMQKTTALSTAEAEYYSASAGSDVLYLRKLLGQLGFTQQSPTPVYEDNTACIEWGNNIIAMDRQGLQVESRRPLRGVYHHDLGS